MRLKKKTPLEDPGEDRVVQAMECPHCGGTSIGFGLYVPMGLFECYDCGYRGSFIVKRRLRVGEEGFTDEYADTLLPED